VQPLVNLMGGHAFNQVFFDNVRVPCANLVGEENRGWYVAATTLDFERSGINRVTWTRRQLDDLKAFLSETAPVDLRSGIKLADLTIELEIARLLCYRVAYLQTLGVVPNYESSMAKLYGSEAIYRFATAAVGLLGLAGQLQPGSKWAALNARIERTYLASVSYSIAGGTSEIQRGVIATRGLNLPR
jgi:alkylation response protein AidB-like acyl-CoA dehydrogenase